jgi:hypothetical protein
VSAGLREKLQRFFVLLVEFEMSNCGQNKHEMLIQGVNFLAQMEKRQEEKSKKTIHQNNDKGTIVSGGRDGGTRFEIETLDWIIHDMKNLS